MTSPNRILVLMHAFVHLFWDTYLIFTLTLYYHLVVNVWRQLALDIDVKLKDFRNYVHSKVEFSLNQIKCNVVFPTPLYKKLIFFFQNLEVKNNF